ncbi:LETM1 domain-containing protein 1-like [Chanos chanos]|uniref:LETM1 domain-containing protein 1-like n=1 Tax=Chanos chanos TaxID=29144 RepID=A0A6J2VQR3_CHACN|nr:LETM1 domain-containing protein 1-like [Chanos chanos]
MAAVCGLGAIASPILKQLTVVHGQWRAHACLRFYSTSHARLGLLQRVNDKYERFLEHRFPRFYVLYHTFMRGFQLLFEDIREVRRIKRSMCRNNIQYRQLPYRDMERLMMFRKDMIKAIPLAVISLPPFAVCLVFVLMYLFPRQLLFRHFWTPQQQRKFLNIEHAQRSCHHEEIMRSVAWTIPLVKEWPQRSMLLNLCSKVQSGAHPSVSDIQAVGRVFSGPPLGMMSLESSHMRLLCSPLLLTQWLPAFLLRRRLVSKSLDLLYLDRALVSLGLEQLSDKEVIQACYLRGLNSSRLNSSQCRDWLHQWLQLSSRVKDSETSLLLHSMVLLTINYPKS